MGPVRIRYFGILWLTRPTYLVLQSIALALCAAVMVVGLVAMLFAGTAWPHLPAPGNELELFAQWLVLLFWLGLLGLMVEGVEMYVMLRKFARAEAEQQARLAALGPAAPTPAAPSSTAVQLPANGPPNTNVQP